jgi:hypothetical protein
VSSAALAAFAASLLLLPGHHGTRAEVHVPPAARASASPVPGLLTALPPTRAPEPTAAASTSGLPSKAARTAPADLLAGDVPDSYLQQVLEQTQPADLSSALEQRLVAVAGQVLLADLTGRGRSAFPGYFGGRSATAAWRSVRIQAGIAQRRPGSSTEVDAHLVYAGIDPRGQALERQDITIVLAPAAGGSGWRPLVTS